MRSSLPTSTALASFGAAGTFGESAHVPESFALIGASQATFNASRKILCEAAHSWPVVEERDDHCCIVVHTQTRDNMRDRNDSQWCAEQQHAEDNVKFSK